jgi:cation diffusion facilitator CzcD-associated flavoprotein CzcO
MNQTGFDHDVAIIGTGFSGMGVSVALDRVGVSDFILLEKSNDTGGTWRDNQYPGACCDVPSQLYSFSFELNPDWSRRFSPAEEIYRYEQHVMDKYHLRQRTRTGFEVASASYDQGGWTLLSTNGDQLRARYLISAIGGLHIPFKPALAGLDRFEGKVMHSAEWDKSYDFAGKKIVVVGSAASAVQIIPQLARTASHVSVMQRTPNWFVPRKDRAVSRFEKTWFRKLPFVQRLLRWRQYCFFDFFSHPIFMQRPSLAKKIINRMVNRHMQRQVKNPALIEKVTPDYDIGCKRILLTDDYLPALQRDNVTLVTDGIDHFTKNGLVTNDGTRVDADLVVLATGFQVSRPLGHMKLTGPGNLTMDQAWATEIRAHRSVAVSGFPNFFMMFGPNSGLGHSSIIIMIEAQAAHIARLLQHARQTDRLTIGVKPEVEAAYNRRLQKALAKTVWNTGCSSWYKDENGHIFTLWPHTTTRFIREMRKASLDEYNFS